MRLLTPCAALAVLALVLPAYAQAPHPQSQPSEAPAANAQSTQNFKAIQIVDVKDLPPDTQKQVNALIMKTTAKDLESLHSSIDALPQVSSALKAKGLSASQVVAANVDDDGTLILITKLS